MIILAIDPGISGALAFYHTDYPRSITVHDMPLLDGNVNPHQLHAIIRAGQPDLAIIEQVHPHPKEGVSSVWRFAAAYTTACVVTALLKVPAILVSPAKWKRIMRLTGGREGKEDARRRAIETFPACEDYFTYKKHHGRAEAALLAVYASQLNEARNYDGLRQS